MSGEQIGMFDLGTGELRARAREPVSSCQCCGGPTKLYRRKLNSGMARTLCWLAIPLVGWATAAEMPHKVRRYATELGKLQLWGLVSRRENPAGESYQEKHQWHITDLGRGFVMGLIDVPSHIFLESPGNKVLGFETTAVSVQGALGKHFDYTELMAGGGL